MKLWNRLFANYAPESLVDMVIALHRERRALRRELRVLRKTLELIRGFSASERVCKESWIAEQIARIDKVLSKRKVKAK